MIINSNELNDFNLPGNNFIKFKLSILALLLANCIWSRQDIIFSISSFMFSEIFKLITFTLVPK
jgi:hypothetical protein